MVDFRGIILRIKKIREDLELSQERFASEIGMKRGAYSMLELADTISLDTVVAIANKFGYSYQWLIEGVGDPMKSLAKAALKKGGVPLVRIEALGGKWNASFIIEEKDILSYYIVPDFQNTSFLLRVKGNSMYPKYYSGDVLACRIINERTFIQWGKAHVLSSKEQGIIIKRLKKSTKNNYILAVSDNPEYEPFEIPETDIEGIALVLGLVRLE